MYFICITQDSLFLYLFYNRIILIFPLLLCEMYCTRSSAYTVTFRSRSRWAFPSGSSILAFITAAPSVACLLWGFSCLCACFGNYSFAKSLAVFLSFFSYFFIPLALISPHLLLLIAILCEPQEAVELSSNNAKVERTDSSCHEGKNPNS